MRMLILTHYTAGTYKARILGDGCKVVATATCTMGEEHAAKAVVTKAHGAAAASSVEAIGGGEELNALAAALTGTKAAAGAKQARVYVWTFNPKAK